MDVGSKLIIPLFPLSTVLFPGGVVPLRIFEPRYLDMVSNSMKNETGIGVVLIREGKETGVAPQTYDTGTVSEISYWHKRNDGMLGITLKGTHRFKILSTSVQPDQLVVAEVEILPGVEEKPVGNHEIFSRILKQIIAQLEPPFTTMDTFYDNYEWVSARLIELLPFELSDKQRMLDMKQLGFNMVDNTSKKYANWFTDTSSPEQLPLLPHVHEGEYEELRYYRFYEKDNHLLVIRLWQSPYHIKQDSPAIPLWFGSINNMLVKSNAGMNYLVTDKNRDKINLLFSEINALISKHNIRILKIYRQTESNPLFIIYEK